MTHRLLSRLFGTLATAASLAACEGAPDDYEGADNTSPGRVDENACAQLQTCCNTLQDPALTLCPLSTEGAECTNDLAQLRSAGYCR